MSSHDSSDGRAPALPTRGQTGAAGPSRFHDDARDDAELVLARTAARFEHIGTGQVEGPALVQMISDLERALRQLLDERDTRYAELAVVAGDAHSRLRTLLAGSGDPQLLAVLDMLRDALPARHRAEAK